MSTSAPLVSIGVPTFNRPDLLRRAMEHLTAQTHTNIEIVVSDNASPNPAVGDVLRELVARDDRVRLYVQQKPLSPFENFIFVLEQARGDYFMWAADDDYFEPWFIERCLRELLVHDDVVLVAAEAQYFLEDRHFGFIAEGEAFRTKQRGAAASRVEHMLHNNYGNLVYGLYRASAVAEKSKARWARTALTSLNEISLLLLVAEAGEIIVLPEVGLHKQAPLPVYEQVVWEFAGGRHPAGTILHPKSILATARYHRSAYRDIVSAINLTSLTGREKAHTRKVARQNLSKHFVQLILGRKPVKRPATTA